MLKESFHKRKEVIGFCSQHATKGDVTFCNSQLAYNLENGIAMGDFYLATESCVCYFLVRGRRLSHQTIVIDANL